MNFYETVGGKRFIDNTVPELIKSIQELTKEIKRSNDIKESIKNQREIKEK